jgi:curved DNA-binding protein
VAGIDRTVVLKIPAETPNGKVFRLTGLGMPILRNPDQRGDLFAVVDVQLPRNITEEENKLIHQWRGMRK